MPRYYPWLKFGRLITSIEAKVVTLFNLNSNFTIIPGKS